MDGHALGRLTRPSSDCMESSEVNSCFNCTVPALKGAGCVSHGHNLSLDIQGFLIGTNCIFA